MTGSPRAAVMIVRSSTSNELDLGTEPIAPPAMAAATPGSSTLPLTTSTDQFWSRRRPTKSAPWR